MQNIKLLRVKQGRHQRDIAEEVGVSISTYRRWEAGVSEPTYTQLRKLAAAFGLDFGRFFRFLGGNGIK